MSNKVVEAQVTLESRQKLPGKVQVSSKFIGYTFHAKDVVCDIALALQHAVAASPATENVTATLKQMAVMDAIFDNTNQQLSTIEDLVDGLNDDCIHVENSVGHVTDAMDRMQLIERNNFFSESPQKELESDFERSDFESNS